LILDEVGIDRKLSARSQKVSGIGEKAFEAVVANVRQRIADQDGRVSLDVTAVDKKQRRTERETALGSAQLALPDKKYGVIYADPEVSRSAICRCQYPVKSTLLPRFIARAATRFT
jgi:hypothetical protein